MRKFLFLSVMVLFAVVPSFAAVSISVSGGYSYSSLAGLNNYWEKVKTDAAAYTTTSTANWKAYGNGVFGNVDLSVNLDTNILIGVRSGAQYVFPSTYSGFRLINVPPLTWMTTDTSIANYLIPIMAGINLYFPMKDSAVAFNLGAYAGWGLAYCSQSTKYNGNPALLALYGTNGFMADLTAAIEVKLLPFLTVSLNGGYRLANMTNYKNINSVSGNVPGYGIITI